MSDPKPMADTPNRLSDPELHAEEAVLETSLRPLELADFVGQPTARESLERVPLRGEGTRRGGGPRPPRRARRASARRRSPASSRTSWASTSRTPRARSIERPADLAGLLTNLAERDVLFIDEIHRLNPVVEEYLYPAMEDFALDILLDRGPSARSVRLQLPRFTLVGATTRAGLLTAPLRARFGLTLRLDYYAVEDLARIVRRSATILGVTIDEAGAIELARRSRGTPRVANRLLRRVRDFAQVKNDGRLDAAAVEGALRLLDVDERGLDDMDRRLPAGADREVRRRAGGHVARSRSSSARSPTRSRTSTSRSSSWRASSSARSAAAWPRPWRTSTSGSPRLPRTRANCSSPAASRSRRNTMKALGAEFFGTFWLVLGGVR